MNLGWVSEEGHLYFICTAVRVRSISSKAQVNVNHCRETQKIPINKESAATRTASMVYKIIQIITHGKKCNVTSNA